MTMIALDSTLAELVTADPSLARELERRGLDYCCGGTRTLQQACAAQDLDPETVFEDLIGPGQSAAGRGVDHHGRLPARRPHRGHPPPLPLGRAAAADRPHAQGSGRARRRHPELHDVADCLGELRADLEPHLAEEERVLFPMIRQLATATAPPAFHCGSIRNPIVVMMREHDNAGELLARLRRLTGDYQPPVDASASYDALTAGCGAGGGHPPAHPQGEQRAVPDGRGARGRQPVS